MQTNMMNEIWKPVVGYEGRYMVSNMGRIKSVRERKFRTADGVMVKKVSYLLKPILQKKSPRSLKYNVKDKFLYYTVSLYSKANGKLELKTHYVHKLVAQAFIGPRPIRACVIDHINGEKYDNRACNLRYVTPSENTCNSLTYRTPLRDRIKPVIVTISGESTQFLSSSACYRDLKSRHGICRSRFFSVVHRGGGYFHCWDGTRVLLEVLML